ncbi:MAG: hemolysin family protein [Mucinivorans sp.]
MNELIIILLLILFNGILAMSEIALISVRKTYLAKEIKRGSHSAKTALKLAKEPDKFLSLIQIGITVIGILTGIYSGSALVDDLADTLALWGLPAAYTHPMAQTMIVILVTYCSLIFGELVPKRIGMSMAEKAAKAVSRPMYFLSIVVSPLVWILSKSTSFIFHLFGFKSDTSTVTEAEIKSMIEQGTKDGQVQEVEQDIVERVFIMGDLKVSSLMTPRSWMVALDINMSSEEIRTTIKSQMHSLYPVVDGSFDKIKGVVRLKDIVFDLEQPDFVLKDKVVAATYFYENQSVYKVLERMKEQPLSHALICDEFGSIQGIVTLQDILEGLVGSIEDTHNEPDIIKRQGSQGWLVDGQCPLFDMLCYFDKEELYVPESNYNTIGGLILELLQDIPQSGQKLRWHCFDFEIVDMDGARIDKILVQMVATPEAEK